MSEIHNRQPVILEKRCALYKRGPSLMDTPPEEWKPVVIPITVVGRTEEAVTLDKSLPRNT